MKHREAIVGCLVSAIVLVEAPKYLVLLPVCRGWALPGVLLSQTLMAVGPFFLARAVPGLADFDKQWIPLARSHWLWFAGMVILLLGVGAAEPWLLSFRKDWFLSDLMSHVMTDVRPARVLLRGTILVLFAPIAEEVFWRAYLLAQLEKLTHWGIATIVQALIFACAHLPNLWLGCPTVFFYGVVLGVWRIKFRSILPLIFAHAVLNGFALIPHLKAEYGAATRAYPKCREIDLVTREPAEKAIPRIIAFIGDDDELVSTYALEVLRRDYWSKAEPYLGRALASADNKTLVPLLFAVQTGAYVGLKGEVRRLAWSGGDVMVQLSAVLALEGLGDDRGLKKIAEGHPNDKVRGAARDRMEWRQEKAKEKARGRP